MCVYRPACLEMFIGVTVSYFTLQHLVNCALRSVRQLLKCFRNVLLLFIEGEFIFILKTFKLLELLIHFQLLLGGYLPGSLRRTTISSSLLRVSTSFSTSMVLIVLMVL